MADRIVRFSEGLRRTRQFWIKRRFELADMIRQLGSQEMVFFTFSAADLQWPEPAQVDVTQRWFIFRARICQI